MTNSGRVAKPAPHQRRGAQRPRLHRLPQSRHGSAGPDAIEFAESLGYDLDDWQKWCIDGLMSEDATGRLIASMVLLIMPRQNGKNVVLEVVELYCFFVLDWAGITHSAHNAETSAAHMARLQAVIEDPQNAALLALVEFRTGSGLERIIRKDIKAEIRFVTRTNRRGRGKSPRMIVFDEALELTDEQSQAIVPSMSAQSMRADAPVLIYASSAPLPSSRVLGRLRRACIDGTAPEAFYAEWSCEAGVDPADRDAWASSNPGLGVRISEDWVEQERLVHLSPEAFLTERLGVVLGLDGDAGELPGWSECSDPASEFVGKPAVAIDVATDQSWTSIGVAGWRSDGSLHLELTEHLKGTASAVDVIAAIAKAQGVTVALDPRSPAGGLVDRLKTAGVVVVEVGSLEAVKACAALAQLVSSGEVRHRNQGPLNLAVQHAAVRAVGDGWVWARRAGAGDVSPLVAVTLAAGQLTATPKTPKPVFAY